MILLQGLTIAIFAFLLTGCAYLEEPRWALLGDTAEEAYYLDRASVKRLEKSLYRYPIKVIPYQEGSPHLEDKTHQTTRVMFVQMNCRQRKMKVECSGFMTPSEKMLFRQLPLSHEFEVVPPNSIHEVTYNYLCNSATIDAIHRH